MSTEVTTDTDGDDHLPRCLFCRMRSRTRFLGIVMCAICRDQAYDFLWVSGVQGILVAVGLLSGTLFVVEEVLLFAVLVIIKHRIKPPWEVLGNTT
jgi:hypothetical protein